MYTIHLIVELVQDLLLFKVDAPLFIGNKITPEEGAGIALLNEMSPKQEQVVMLGNNVSVDVSFWCNEGLK